MPHGTAADVNRAVAAAEAAHPAWAALEPKERAKLVKKLAAKLREKTDEILRVEVVDTGNTITKMRADVASAGDTLDYLRGLPHRDQRRDHPGERQEPALHHPRALWRGRAASSRSTIRSSSPPTRWRRR